MTIVNKKNLIASRLMEKIYLLIIQCQYVQSIEAPLVSTSVIWFQDVVIQIMIQCIGHRLPIVAELISISAQESKDFQLVAGKPVAVRVVDSK